MTFVYRGINFLRTFASKEYFLGFVKEGKFGLNYAK